MDGLILGWDDCASRQGNGFGFVQGKSAERKVDAAIVDKAESHMLVCSPAGTGKGRSFAIPALLSYGGSAVVVDIKGELYATTAAWRQKLGPVLVIDPMSDTRAEQGSLNPLQLIDPSRPSFVDDVYRIADLFSAKDAFGGRDGRFWEDSGTDVVAGVIAQVVASSDEARRNFGRVYELLSSQTQLWETLGQKKDPGRHPFAGTMIDRFFDLPDSTRGGVAASFNHQTRMLASPAVRDSLAGNTLDVDWIGAGKPFTIYLVMPPDSLESHAALIRIYLSYIVRLLMRRRHAVDLPTLMIIDEARHIGAVPDLVTATTLGRSFGLKVAWVVQSLSQLKATYKKDWEAIVENCGSLVTFGPSKAYSSAKAMAEHMFGDVTADTIFGLAPDEALVRTEGARSKVVRKLDYLSDQLFAGRCGPNPYHVKKNLEALRAA